MGRAQKHQGASPHDFLQPSLPSFLVLIPYIHATLLKQRHLTLSSDVEIILYTETQFSRQPASRLILVIVFVIVVTGGK